LGNVYWKGKLEDVDEKGMHPLHAAAEINNLEAFKILLDHGGDVNAYRTDRNCGDQPIHSAAFECKTICCRIEKRILTRIRMNECR
jgi:ankyrin repeat protein